MTDSELQDEVHRLQNQVELLKTGCARGTHDFQRGTGENWVRGEVPVCNICGNAPYEAGS